MDQKKDCLFVFRDHIVKGIVQHLASCCYAINCHSKNAESDFAPLSNLANFLLIWKKIHGGKIKKAIIFSHHYDLARPEKNIISNIVRVIKFSFFRFPSFSVRLYEILFHVYNIPFIVYDDEDHTQINKRNWGLLKKCRLYFKLHTPVNIFYSFLHQDDRTGTVHNIHRTDKFKNWIPKIKPISLGIDIHELNLRPTKKIYDVFFAGTVKYSWIRIKGMEELMRLKENSSLKIAVFDGHVPYEDFIKYIRSSWLILSPEGGCYDSFRHYESLLNYSVPLINYPQVIRYKPMVDGEHCVFYPPEQGGLTRKILDALDDKQRLERIALHGREFVLKNHLQKQLAEMMLSSLDE